MAATRSRRRWRRPESLNLLLWPGTLLTASMGALCGLAGLRALVPFKAEALLFLPLGGVFLALAFSLLDTLLFERVVSAPLARDQWTFAARRARRPRVGDVWLWLLVLGCVPVLVQMLELLALFWREPIAFVAVLLLTLPVVWVAWATLGDLLFERGVELTVNFAGVLLSAPLEQNRRLYLWSEISGVLLERGRVLLLVTPPIGPAFDPWNDPGMDGSVLVALPSVRGLSPGRLWDLLERERQRWTEAGA